MWSSLSTSFRRFKDDARGGAAVLFGLSIIPVAGMAGIAVDYSRGARALTQLQAAVDAAALAGAGQSSGARAATALSMFQASVPRYITLGTGSPSFTENADGSVSGSASGTVATTMAQLVGTDKMNIYASAKAYPATSGSPGCILLLDKTMQHAFASRSNSQLDASKCDVRVNSNGSGAKNSRDAWEDSDKANKAAIFVSDSNFKFASFCAVGSIQGSVPGVSATPCAGVANDPFIGHLPDVSPSACTTTNTYSGKSFVSPSPGTYCGTMTFSGTIAAGVYYIKTAPSGTSSKLTIAGGATGTDVTFYFVDENATLDLTGSGTKLWAPSSGTFANYLFFMPSNLSNKKTVAITSLDKNNWKGVIYTPNWDIEIKSWSQDTLAAICWVANSMVWDSESQVTVSPGDLAISYASDGTASLATLSSFNSTPRLAN